jgi:hypothetical protein
MKSILLSILGVASTFAAVSYMLPNRPDTSFGVSPGGGLVPPAQEIRAEFDPGWESASASFFDEPEGYRAKVMQEIESYARGTQALTRRSDQSRSYLRTRIQALNEHVDFARNELLVLSADPSDDNYTPAHARFHTTLTGLREAFAQTFTEVNGTH